MESAQAFCTQADSIVSGAKILTAGKALVPAQEHLVD
jgi:hypothetical protein